MTVTNEGLQANIMTLDYIKCSAKLVQNREKKIVSNQELKEF
jgi:hypothetical protein